MENLLLDPTEYEPKVYDPYIEVCLTEGNKTMMFEGYELKKACNAEFKFRSIDEDKEDEDEEDEDNEKDFDSFVYPLKDDKDGFLISRELISHMISNLRSCKDNTENMTILRTWEETLYFLLDYALRRMRRDFASFGVRRGASFKLIFYERAAKKGRRTGPSSLLRRHELDKDDACSRADSCAVCLEYQLEGGGDLMCMPCSHTFHYRCLAEWLCKSLTCPLCRHEMSWSVYR